MTEPRADTPRVRRPPEVTALIIAAVCLALLILCAIRHPSQVFRSWLFGWIFWLGVSLGSLGVLMLHHLTGGGWGYLVRRIGEAAAMCLMPVIVLFLPILLGTRYIYPWLDPAELRENAKLRYKHDLFLNWPFWSARSIVYLLIFGLLVWLIRSPATELSEPELKRSRNRLNGWSAIGMVVYFVVMALAAIDWLMSRQPNWHSSVFGFIVCMGQGVSGLCALLVLLWLFSGMEPLASFLDADWLNDLGNVLLTFVVLWAYVSFSQFLITWVGNSQDEISWYIRRTAGAWRWVGGALILFHFLVPFVLLLQRPMKRRLPRLAALAALIFLVHIFDELYWVTPADPHPAVWGYGPWLFAEAMNVLAFLCVGGVWVATFLWLLSGRPLLAPSDRAALIAMRHAEHEESGSPAVE